MTYYADETTADALQAWSDSRLDADMEMAAMAREGNRASYHRARGICQHGSAVGHRSPAIYPAQQLLLPGESACTEGCGAIFPSDEAWVEAMRDARDGYSWDGQTLADRTQADAYGYDPDDYEATPAAFCDTYAAHDSHIYSAINRNTYACPGFTADDVAALEAQQALPPCEHGLSASLCAGPGHYPADS